MTLALLAILLAPQTDPFKTLADAAKRADASARKSALADFRAGARQSPIHYVAAKFLERSEADWKLGEPAAADLNAFLAKFWAAAPADPQVHKDALAALVAAVEKHGSDAGAFRLFAQAHMSALGDRGAAFAGKLGYSKQGDRWGTREYLPLYALAKGFSKPAYIPAAAERAARASKDFGPRYVAGLLDIQKTLFANTGFEKLYKGLPMVAGRRAKGPRADHMNALAESLKAAVSCGGCDGGKVACDRCKGKKRTTITCVVCKGLGWQQKGAAANVLIPCRNCRGRKFFKNVTCPVCKRKGKLDCRVCLGKGWRDNFKGCKDCRVCQLCWGRRIVEKNCATCGGKGRVPPIRLGIPTILCGGCKGQAQLKEPCRSCAETGLANCSTCGGRGPRDGKSPARPKVADVYGTSPCDPCGGKGWPLPNLAVPCDACFGLGFKASPTSAPDLILK